MSDIQLKLGSRVFSDLSTEKVGDWEMIHNRNQVYTQALSENGIDKAQFEYDPDKKWFRFGRLIQRASSATDQGEESYYNVYLKPYIVGQGGAVVDQGSGGGTTEGEGSGTGIGSLFGGDGIIIDYSNGSENPLIKVDRTSVPTVEALEDLIRRLDNLQPGSGGSGGSSDGNQNIEIVNYNTPDLYALIELLEVMKVMYDGEPIGNTHETVSDIETGAQHLSTGVRFKWMNEDFTCNCLRFKNINVGGNRQDKDIYLKFLECKRTDALSDAGAYGYGEIGSSVLTVSSNAINFKQENEQGQWYEWYFPKQITLKANTVYAIIPHHDKSYPTITESDAKFIVYGSSDVHTGNTKVTSIWTSPRTAENQISQTPIVQFCNKIPTTIIMKR